MTHRGVTVRPGGPADLRWALALAPELASFGLPPWRSYDAFVEECRTSIRTALEGDDPENIVLVAVDSDGTRLGLSHVVVRQDRSTGAEAVHVDDFVVESVHRGLGVGSLLIEESERWARDCGVGAMALAVFQDNAGARRFYARHGFRDDIVRVVKPLRDGRRS